MDITRLVAIVNGAERGVDLTANTPVVLSIKIGGGTNTELTKTILDRLVSVQNGSDVDATYHTHDGRYFTETELGSSSSSSGSDLIGDDNTYSNFTPSAATVKGALAGIDAALASSGSNTFDDSLFRIFDDGDNTKNIAFQASGISTATTRTITMPDANVDLAKVLNAIQKDGSVTFTANQPMGGFKLTGLAAGSGAGDSVRYEQAILASGVNAFAANQSMGGNKLTNVADPTSAQDAATKAYVDAVAQGLRPKQAVRAATLVAGTLATSFENGDVIDGVTLATGNRILIKNQAAPAENGIYIVAASGAPSRAPDFDSLSPIDEINGAYTFIQEGTQAGQGWVETGAVATIGTDPINFVYFNAAASIVGGDMIAVTGQTISVDLATVSGLESTNPGNAAGQLRIKLEASNPSLKITGSNELGVKLDGAGALLSGASGIAVQVDGSTIEINSNALRVKDAGITLAKLASNSVDENKIVSTAFNAAGAITGGGGSKLAVQVDAASIEISSNALRIKTTAYDQDTITGGGGSAAAVQKAPLFKRPFVAGESFASQTSFAVRMALNGETAGRVYKADQDASATDKFYVIGMAQSVAGTTAGQSIPVTILGEMALGTSDGTPFAGTDIGKAVFLTSAGAFSLTAPSTANNAVVRVGIVQETTKIFVQPHTVGVN